MTTNGDAANTEPAPVVVTLRPVRPADGGLIRRWLQNPDVRRWWGNAASAEAEIRLAGASDAAICCIIEVAGLPVGYAHAVETGLLGAIPDGVDAGSWDCDLFIGSEPHRGRGFGQAALDLLVKEVFRSTLAVACVIEVSVKNERAARAYEGIGFQWSSIHQDALLGPCWIMQRHRPPAGVTQ